MLFDKLQVIAACRSLVVYSFRFLYQGCKGRERTVSGFFVTVLFIYIISITLTDSICCIAATSAGNETEGSTSQLPEVPIPIKKYFPCVPMSEQ